MVRADNFLPPQHPSNFFHCHNILRAYSHRCKLAAVKVEILCPLILIIVYANI